MSTKVMSNSPSSGPESAQSGPPRRRRHKIAWATVSIFIVLAAIAAYATLHQGVRRVDFPHGTIEFQNVQPSEIQKRQPAIKTDVAAAEQRAQQQGVSSPLVPNISGYWRSNYGLIYLIQQYGDRAVMQEQSPYGITAVAEGTVAGNSADFAFRTVDGSTGRAYLDFHNDGTMGARFDNNTYNTSIQAVLIRR